MPHILCHNVRTGRRGAAQHDEQCNQFLIPEPQHHSHRHKHRRQPHGLQQGCCQCGHQLFDGLGPLKTGTDGQQRQRGGDGSQIVQRFGGNSRQADRQQRKHRAGDNAQQDRVGGHAFQQLLQRGRTFLFGRFQHQNQHSKNVEQRYAAQHHQRGHARRAVDVLDERHAQHSRTAAVAGLYELAYDGLIPDQDMCRAPDH